MLFDSHTHVNFKDFDEDRDAVILRCLADDVWMINVGSDAVNSQKAIDIAHQYEKGVYASVGIHPNDSDDADFSAIENMAKDDKVVAIGETGLDYYCSQASEKLKGESVKKEQKELFMKHIELSQKVKKPLIIHCRDAHHDLISILNSYSKIPNSACGVMHFFCGTAEEALAYCNLGFYISFSGVVTFARDYDEAVRAVPLERILVETDAPFVAPVPFRGKRNEPRYVEYAARKVAEIKGLSFEEVAEQTTQNARKLFRI